MFSRIKSKKIVAEQLKSLAELENLKVFDKTLFK